jgi:hypothetical protein
MAEAKKPNIPVIMGDDIGWFNISAYNLGVMGYRTLNVDRIAKEGALFTDWYGQQSCTAGRAVEAVLWGMPAVNFALMYQAFVNLQGGPNYDGATRALIRNTRWSSRSPNALGLQKNTGGSTNIYFGPQFAG